MFNPRAYPGKGVSPHLRKMLGFDTRHRARIKICPRPIEDLTSHWLSFRFY